MKEGPHLYAERLKLVLGGIAQSLPIGFLLATLLVVVFTLTSGQRFTATFAGTGEAVQVMGATVDGRRLSVWYLAVLLGRLWVVIYAKRTLRRGIDFANLRTITRHMAAGKVAEGFAWGSLGWIVVHETSSPAATAMLLGVMAAMSSHAVSLLAPVRILYVALILPMLLLTSLRFMVMDGTIYQAMGGCCLLYVVGQYGQARLIGRALSESITLRFENLALIERLEVEKEVASLARERAEQANQAKSRFLAAASHDLRQPIHALGLFLEALSNGPAGTLQKPVLDNAKAASLASTEMLNTLLDFSRIEAGVVHPKPVACRVQLILHKLERELAPQADAKGLAYRTRDSETIVLTDPALLELILRNLIANAIRYTDQGGLLIGCRTRGAYLSIEVVDTGIGIAADQQSEVFREFHQLGNPERDRRKGLGLGLAIAEGLARSLDHPLSLTSRLGRGSVFRVVVPLANEVPPAVIEHVDPPRTSTLEGRRLLVIDDDESVRLAMDELLTQWGCECMAVDSLTEAMRRNIACPDLIVCDYRLRERQTGDEVIRQLRVHYAHPVPALLVTGDTDPKRLREAMTSGVTLLHKPVAPDQLWVALTTLLVQQDKTASEGMFSPSRLI